MSLLFITILIVLLIARLLQSRLHIPLPLSLLVLTYLLYLAVPLPHLEEYFDETLLLLLPLLLLPDVMNFKVSDLKKFGFSIFYLAFISVVLSIAAGLLLNSVLFAPYSLTIGMLIALFAMVLATDAVSVGAIFAPFKLPHSLKVLTEGESLFNDATAVIAFFMIAIPLINGKAITPTDVSFILLKVLLLSVFIGLVVGYVAQFIMRFFHEALDEFIMLLLTAYVAFAIAELHAIHVSGILALITSVMTLKVFINRSLDQFHSSTEDLNSSEKAIIKKPSVKLITTKARLDQNREMITFFAFFANAILFFSLAQLVHFEQMMLYWKEIISLFIATTLIRAIMMLKFAYVSNKLKKMVDINYRWWGVLTFAGIKGGLSMIMVHALPDTFIHKAMFEQIVMGIIILSIFVYAAALILIISKYKVAFEHDMKHEKH
jgi:monovalent cation:H+ antiporter, CPA1 family